MSRAVEISDGARALKRSGKTGADIARLCGVSQQLVSLWLRGKKRPGPEHRARLEALGLVKAEQWEQDKASGRKAPPRPTAVQEPPGRLDTRAKLEAQVRRLETLLDAELSASASVQVERALGQALAGLAKLEGTHLTEAAALRLPSVRRVLERMAVLRAEALRMGWSVAELVRAEAAEFERMTET